MLRCRLLLVEGTLSCKNEAGKDVDWHLMYKIPKMQPRNENFMQPKGGEYAYTDAKDKSQYWTFSTSDIYKVNNPIAWTIKHLTDKKEPENIMHIVYNDQPPPPHNKTRGGHTKGALMYDGQSLVWIHHTVPQFFRELHSGNYVYPPNGRENGQVIMCVTFPGNSLPVIAEHLLMQRPFIYDKHKFEKWEKKFPILERLLAENFRKEREGKFFAVSKLRSKGGSSFTIISKSPKLQKDIYSELLSKYTTDSQYVETWRNGAGNAMTSTCRGLYSVMDVDTVKLKFSKSKSIEFSYREDHSKWAVSFSKPTFCVGSLNRMKSQFDRGGGVLCINNARVAKVFRQSVERSFPCGKKT
ncbi:plancitoxin-1-like isoform X2 [Ornithodoros turicata]|uniref:plancitoxin-1-like isoform X2 n=1 Tax=Ornithodoros turicata TaxID=34597 RepID=UPI0031395662